eukprot:GHVQ01025872.1.p4 GENE.GHVQ01025872.1~~GHVQ01025872.1.p4  ORF type:complete len:111 (-),score=10.64 GHVQ01025872.1:137-469(-)
MKDTIRRIIVMCESCQRRHMCERRHRNTHTGVSSIHSLTGDTACQTVGMDFFGPLPTARSGYKYILVIIDHFTKWPYYPQADGIAEEFMKVLGQQLARLVNTRHTDWPDF